MHQRHFRWYGADGGRPVVYFHGLPGAAIECGRFHALALAANVRLIALDRAFTERSLIDEFYFERLASEVVAIVGEEPFEAIGFSMGGFIALRAAPYLADQLTRLHLVSAPAPLESGDFLNAMAGKALFRMAQRAPKMLRRLAGLQGWLALNAPGLLFRMLFAGAAGADRALAADAGFRAEMECVMAQGLGAGGASFARDLREYVRPWADRLGEVKVETHIWHGAADNWAPAPMVDALARLIPGVAGKTVFPDLSHYSCLYACAPGILAARPNSGHSPVQPKIV